MCWINFFAARWLESRTLRILSCVIAPIKRSPGLGLLRDVLPPSSFVSTTACAFGIIESCTRNRAASFRCNTKFAPVRKVIVAITTPLFSHTKVLTTLPEKATAPFASASIFLQSPAWPRPVSLDFCHALVQTDTGMIK